MPPNSDDLLVGVGADLTGLRQDLKGATKYFNQFRDDVRAIATKGDLLNLSVDGHRAATTLLGGLERRFAERKSTLKEQLSTGLIDRQRYEIEGTRAAEAFNEGLTGTIRHLDRNKMLPPGLRQELVSSFRDIGVASGQQMADAIAERMERVGAGLQGAGRVMTAGITAPILALGAAGIAAEEQLDDALDRIRIGTGRTGAALHSLEGDFDAVFAALPVSAHDASVAITDLNIRTGETGAALRGMATDVLQLSRLTGTDLARNIESTQKLFRNFGIGVRDQGDALNFLFKVTQQTGVRLDDLAGDLTRFGPALRGLGFNFQQSAALIAQFNKEGVDVDTLLGRLQQGLARFAKKGFEAPEAFRALIEQIKQADTETRAINIASNVFGSRGAAGFAAAVREGRISFDELLESVGRSHETLEKAAADTDGFKENLTKLKNEATRAFLPLGNELVAQFNGSMPAMLEMTRVVAGMIRSFVQLPSSVRNTILVFAGMAAAIGPILIGVGSLVSGLGGIVRIMPTVVSAISSLIGAASLAGLASLLLPGGIILVGLGLIAAAFYASGAAARQAQREIEQYRGALAGLGPAALPALNQSVQAMQAQVDLLKRQRAEIVRTEGEVSTFASRSDLGTGTRDVKSPGLARIDAQLQRLQPLLDAARTRFNTLLDAELASETGAHRLANAVGKVTTAGTTLAGLDFDFGTDKASQQMAQLASNVRALLGTYKEVGAQIANTPQLVDALVAAHGRVSTALAKQKDQYGTTALQLKDILRDLDRVNEVTVALARRKFLSPDALPPVGKPTVVDVIPRFDLGAGGLRLPPEATRLVVPVEQLQLRPGAVSDFRKALAAQMRNTQGLQDAQLFGSQEEIAAAARFAADSADVLRASMRALDSEVRNSTLADADKVRLLDQMRKTARDAGLELRTLTTSGSRAARSMDTIVTAGRGLLNVLSIVKGIDQALLGVARSALDAIDALKQMNAAKAAGDTLGAVTGGAGVLAAGVSMWSTVISSFRDINREEREQRKAIAAEQNQRMTENTRALEANRVALDGFDDTIADKLKISQAVNLRGPTGNRDFLAFLDKLANAQVDLRRSSGFDQLDKAFRSLGVSLAYVQKVADDLGVVIIDEAGHLIPGAFDILDQAIRNNIEALTTFRDTLSDQRSIQDLLQDVFDVEQSPVQQLQNELGLLAKLAPDLFEQFFAGIDVTTDEGRQQAEAALRLLVTALRDGAIDIAEFGELMGKDELGEIIRNADHALDSLADTADKVSESLLNVPTGFKLNKARFDAQLAQGEERIANILRGGGIPTPKPVPIPTGAAATPTDAALQQLVAQLRTAKPGLVIEQMLVEISGADDPEKQYQTWRDTLERKSQSAGANAQVLVLNVPR